MHQDLGKDRTFTKIGYIFTAVYQGYKQVGKPILKQKKGSGDSVSDFTLA